MRYQIIETVNAAQVFPTGLTVTVQVLKVGADTIETLTSASAPESSQIDGLYIWPSSNLQTQPTVYTEFIVVFTESVSGAQKMAKIILGGYVDSIDMDISALNDLSIADIQTALDNQGYTAVRAALLDNLDQAITTTETNIIAAVAALNNLSIADVQTALDNQGYTSIRAALLDNLDQALTTTETNILAAVSALNDISVAQILAASVASGDTVDDALSRLDNLDTDVVAMWALLKGGRDIDFAGNDALGWQRIERDTGGSEVARYNLFDQSDNRITGTVADFFTNQLMIAKEVLL